MLTKPNKLEIQEARRTFKTSVVYTIASLCHEPKDSIDKFKAELPEFIVDFSLLNRSDKKSIRGLLNEMKRLEKNINLI